MSAFCNWHKDEVVYAIEELFKSEASNGNSVPDILESIMEAVTYGIKNSVLVHVDKPTTTEGT
jgi:hypothetical protein